MPRLALVALLFCLPSRLWAVETIRFDDDGTSRTVSGRILIEAQDQLLAHDGGKNQARWERRASATKKTSREEVSEGEQDAEADDAISREKEIDSAKRKINMPPKNEKGKFVKWKPKKKKDLAYYPQVWPDLDETEMAALAAGLGSDISPLNTFQLLGRMAYQKVWQRGGGRGTTSETALSDAGESRQP